MENKLLNINSFGFRGPEIKKEKAQNEYRIFVLGGSTVFNVAIPYNKTFERLLEEKLAEKFPQRQIKVINAGADGYTSEHSLIQYMFYIRDFNPDLIISLQGINDMYYSCAPPYFTSGTYSSDYSHSYGSLAKMINSYFSDKISININSVVLNYVSSFIKDNFYSDITNKYVNYTQYQFKIGGIKIHEYRSIDSYLRNLNYFASIVSGDHTRLIFINQPYLYSVKNKYDALPRNWFVQRFCSDGKNYPNLESLIYGINLFNSATKSIADKNNLMFVDLESQVPKSLDYFTDDVHYTEKGNSLIADILHEYILENILKQ